jgi:hypothetical protein
MLFWVVWWLSVPLVSSKSECKSSLVHSEIPPPVGYEKHSKAQTKEDLYLYKNLFYQTTSGLILESGALDGVRFSSTYMLNRLFNWTSIHIEGLFLTCPLALLTSLLLRFTP